MFTKGEIDAAMAWAEALELCTELGINAEPLRTYTDELPFGIWSDPEVVQGLRARKVLRARKALRALTNELESIRIPTGFLEELKADLASKKV